jgi:16S rRNA (guanine527-N7)-methyltransferase
VLHSLAIANVCHFVPGTRIIDIGTGGGFPGIPLAILFPAADFILVDSIAKKAKVASTIARSLALKNTTVLQCRAEKLSTAQYDFIIGRAVGALPSFVHQFKRLIRPQSKNTLKNGILYLKGEPPEEELKVFPKLVQYRIAVWFEEPFFESKHVVYLPLK